MLNPKFLHRWVCTFFRDEESAHADRDIAIMKYMAKHKAQACVTNSCKLCRKSLCLISIRSKYTVSTCQYIIYNYVWMCML
jgi:hypothetical protein